MKPLIGRFILVVDCDATGLSRWREHLLAEGGRVIGSGSLDSAIANALTFPGGTFDAALVEHRPPNLDAVEVVEVMRALPGTGKLPLLIVASAQECAAIERQLQQPGMVLARPVSADTAVLRLGRLFAAVRTPGSVDAVPPPQGRRGRILVAEDDPVNAETLRAMLDQLGYEVVVAANGEEAVARAASCQFDAILMDGQMPVMNGLDATRIIRDDEARRGLHRRIIGVTANTFHEYRDQCVEAGMDDVVQKPVGMAALVRALSQWLKDAGGRTLNPTLPEAGSSTIRSVSGASQAPELPADDVIDWGQIDSLRSIDPQGKTGIVGRAIGLYIDNAPKLIDEIRGYRSAKDLAEVRRAAHSLKSSSASLGAMIVAGLSKTIEHAAAQGDFEIIGATVSSLESEYWRAANELRKAVA